MPELHFRAGAVGCVPFSASPLIGIEVHVSGQDGVRVEGGLARCQVRIEAPRRRYSEAEAQGLSDLFGERHRWGQTVRSLLWGNASAMIPAFTTAGAFQVELPCSAELALGAHKYLAALQGGEIPVSLSFTGTFFYRSPDGALQASPLPSVGPLSVAVPWSAWREALGQGPVDRALVPLDRASYARLESFRSRAGYATFELAIDALLARQEGLS